VKIKLAYEKLKMKNVIENNTMKMAKWPMAAGAALKIMKGVAYQHG
jgi:hypothetical protein